jgi:benzoyl-CoA reductase/2-hydroxyglutaryl-CoA dehydratase subunit BcrC/BadD/HgdB
VCAEAVTEDLAPDLFFRKRQARAAVAGADGGALNEIFVARILDCLGCYTNLGLPTRVDLLEQYIADYNADGFLVNSVKSCNSFSVGQLMMLRQLETRTGVPGLFIENDLVDPRYFSAANIKNRIESYLQMLDQKRGVAA